MKLCLSGDRDRDIDRDREQSIFRIRERRRLDTSLREEALKTLDRERGENLSGESMKKQQPSSQCPIMFGEELQFWTEKVIINFLVNEESDLELYDPHS